MLYTNLGKTGFKVSRLGLGGAPFGGAFGDISDKQVAQIVHAGLDGGINFIDTAPAYGNGESERKIGLALKGGKRERLVLATKVVNRGESFGYSDTMRSVESSLMRLRTEWIDLIQVHDVERTTFEVVMNETLPALRKLAEQGKVRNVGVTGRTLNLLMQYMNTGEFDTVQMYARFSLVDYTAKDALIPLAKERNIGIINSSVLYSGTLADAPITTANSDIVAMIRERMQQLEFLRQTNEPGGLIEPAMRFSLGNPDIQVTLSGATSPSMIQETMAFCDGNGLEMSTLNKLYALFDGELFS